jgi:hypothetical protein
MRKLCHWCARFNCTLDCIEFRDITSFLSPLEFKVIVEKLTNVRFTDGEVSKSVAYLFVCLVSIYLSIYDLLVMRMCMCINVVV